MTCASKSNPAPLRYEWKLRWGEEQNGTQLTIKTLRESSNNVYTFEVINEMNATFSDEIVKGNLTTSFTFEILSPSAAQFIENYTVLLNTTLSVVCPYIPGNPPETRFMWFRGNTSLIRSEQTLLLTSLKTADEGSYTCKISNILDPTGRDIEEAFDETTFYVDVKYPSTIKRFYIDGLFSTNTISITEGQNVTFYCEADSDPVAVLQIVNKTRGSEHLLREIHDNTISAEVSNARCEYDMGVYQCKGNNSYNAVKQVMEFEIMILCSPRPSPFTPPIKTSFRKINTSVILSFTIVAYPPPNGKTAYSWRKLVEQYWEPLNNTSRHQISISDDRLQSSL
ncbi:hypothetical protein DPMN_157631 [Dreissena polymorpha]|uniref:Ig-like domain-containing protein n=1 Tax=Dreissena polymorpha TaxID=45954 RepID=A0A9D4IP07_DREPO|nr:hypothetical protein DPMN_157631 [Dreissena polymorpha]